VVTGWAALAVGIDSPVEVGVYGSKPRVDTGWTDALLPKFDDPPFVVLLGRARVEVAECIVVPDQGFGRDILEIASRCHKFLSR
jgi:hypothetical protein